MPKFPLMESVRNILTESAMESLGVLRYAPFETAGQ